MPLVALASIVFPPTNRPDTTPDQEAVPVHKTQGPPFNRTWTNVIPDSGSAAVPVTVTFTVPYGYTVPGAGLVIVIVGAVISAPIGYLIKVAMHYSKI
jgi:hypothetical protein